MYFWNLATFMAILQSCNASEPINSFNDDILDMSKANIEKKTSLLDTDFYCTLNNSNAHEWYNWIKNHPEYFGHLTALTVFRGKDFTLKKAPNACQKIISIETEPATSHCRLLFCYNFPPKEVALTIIYA